ncbi:MAG: electron transfer flavoprotein subunit alpha [Firmicutes bacterium]|nr:electron transfer flavoprotein subunit alpha [Bacillota bacterium]
MEIRLRADNCTICGACEDACPYDAITVGTDGPEFSEECTLCGACVEVCPTEAIYIAGEEISAQSEPGEARGDVWVFAEQRDGQLLDVVLELLGEGRRLAAELEVSLGCLLLGDGVDHLAQELVKFGADRVYVGSAPELKGYRGDLYAQVMEYSVKQYRPEILLIGGTANGRSLAPRVATRLGTGLTADCTAFALDEDGNLLQTRPAFGGNLMATIRCPNHRPQMATVRPKVFPKPARDPNRKGEIIHLELPPLMPWQRILEVVEAADTGPNLVEADIVVAGGRGLGSPENFRLVEELASVLGAAVGASRAVVDAGWVSYPHQVGQTGRTVAPKIYIACGISGAIQHIVGMQSSDIIVAINSDPDAPIFSIATYGIVGKVEEIIPALIREIKGSSSQ